MMIKNYSGWGGFGMEEEELKRLRELEKTINKPFSEKDKAIWKEEIIETTAFLKRNIEPLEEEKRALYKSIKDINSKISILEKRLKSIDLFWVLYKKHVGV